MGGTTSGRRNDVAECLRPCQVSARGPRKWWAGALLESIAPGCTFVDARNADDSADDCSHPETARDARPLARASKPRKQDPHRIVLSLFYRCSSWRCLHESLENAWCWQRPWCFYCWCVRLPVSWSLNIAWNGRRTRSVARPLRTA